MRKGGTHILCLCLVALCLLASASLCSGARLTPGTRSQAAAAPALTKGTAKFNNGTDIGPLTFEHARAMDIFYFATAAYCNATSLDAWDSGRKVRIHPGMKDVSAYNTTVPLLWRIEKAPVLFFVLYDPKNNSVVLSFEGTQGDQMGDWVDDFMFAMSEVPTSWGWPSEEYLEMAVRIEEGFMLAWNEMRSHAYNLTTDLLREYPTAKFYITGHSLGGALAGLASADLTLLGIPIERVYTFGSPRVGNLGWSYLYNEMLDLKDRTFRVVNGYDPVPHVPFTGVTFMRGYHHVGIEVWLNGYDFVQCNNVLPYDECKYSATCFYNEDLSCSASQHICLTPSCIEMHLTYFQIFSDDKFCKEGC